MEVKLHDIGEGMTEGDVLTYFIKEGDMVEEDQPIVELQTEKMVTELTAPAKGMVKKILIDEGKTIPVGTTILIIESDGLLEKTKAEEKQPIKSNHSVLQVATQTKTKIISGPKRIKAAPYTRKVAREQGVDITFIKGTGKAGRITVEDIYRFSENRANLSPVCIDKKESKKSEHTSEFLAKKTAEIVQNEEVEVIPFKGRRKQIAKKMTKSLFTIPHVSHFEEIDMTNLLNYRKEIKRQDVTISVVAFFIKALAIALKEYPIFNAKLDEENEQIKLEKMVHIGLATDSKEGLIVPVLRNVEKKSLLRIHAEMKELTKKAQENKITLNEMTGSTFTISNVGPMGSTGATPIINYPETGLMAFHKTKKMPVVNEENEIVIRSMMNVTLVFDHRVTDGGNAVAFTNRLKSLIENPVLLMLELV